MNPIYLDHAATTPVHPDVVAAMVPYLTEHFGNPSSIHGFGRKVRLAIEDARETVARALGTDPARIVFTSGGTEADNLALFGPAFAHREKGKTHLVTTQIEHHAVLEACEHLERLGFSVTYLPVDRTGRVDPDDVARAIRPETVLVTVMYGNNEVGTLQPIAEIGRICRERGVYFHTDAVQAFGVEPIDVATLPVDLLTISAHKIGGPKGVGALYVAREVVMYPHLFGGNQERKRRAGTENVPGIIGFAKAVEIAMAEREKRRERYRAFRRLMLSVWEARGIDHVVNGHPEAFLPHVLNVSFPGVDTETMLMNLDLAGIAASSGSACTSGSLERSHVLKAMNLPHEVVDSAVRFSFGPGNTEEDVRAAAERVADIVARLRGRK